MEDDCILKTKYCPSNNHDRQNIRFLKLREKQNNECLDNWILEAKGIRALQIITLSLCSGKASKIKYMDMSAIGYEEWVNLLSAIFVCFYKTVKDAKYSETLRWFFIAHLYFS